MPALRVSKPSGMGGARQLLGAWRGGGLPGGGDTGPLTWSPQAYLNTRTDPTPTTKGSTKATGQENWGGGVLGNHGEGEPPHLLHCLETGRGSGGPQRNLMEALKEGDKDYEVWELQRPGPILFEFKKRRLGGFSKPVRPYFFPYKVHTRLGTGPTSLSAQGMTFPP